MPEVKPLAVIDGKNLSALDCEPPKFIISRILPTGLSILSGSPKVGKSWLALWLCQQVSRGEPVWAFDTLKCSVLYLALEDTVDRLHFRLSHITEEGSADSYFATDAASISGGLPVQLEKFMQDRADTGLIVIDTLQRIRGAAMENKSGYAFDYEDMNIVKAIADKLKIAVLLVHHTRKLPDSDPFNTVSGSTGLTGSADTMFVLEKEKRAENKAVLHITGRDVEDMQINLEFDREMKIWKFVSFASGGDNPAEKLIAAVASFLSDGKSFNGTMSELLDALTAIDSSIVLKPNTLSRSLKEYALTLEKRYKVKMDFTRTKDARTISLSVGDDDGCFSDTPNDDDNDFIVTPYV